MTYESFLDAFASEINVLADQNLLRWESLLDGSWNQQSWLHARIFGAMVKAVRQPASPMVEVKWNQGFVPDLCLVDNGDNVIGVVEYESTNSSDERLVGKDLLHFENAIQEFKDCVPDLPGWWLVVSTLPNRPVQRWPWYADKKLIGWNIATDYPPAIKSRSIRNTSPLVYYEEGLHRTLNEMMQRLSSVFSGACPASLVWANIDGEFLSVMNVNGEPALNRHPSFPLRMKG